jgi:hypothetical protein
MFAVKNFPQTTQIFADNCLASSDPVVAVIMIVKVVRCLRPSKAEGVASSSLSHRKAVPYNHEIENQRFLKMFVVKIILRIARIFTDGLRLFLAHESQRKI